MDVNVKVLQTSVKIKTNPVNLLGFCVETLAVSMKREKGHFLRMNLIGLTVPRQIMLGRSVDSYRRRCVSWTLVIHRVVFSSFQNLLSKIIKILFLAERTFDILKITTDEFGKLMSRNNKVLTHAIFYNNMTLMYDV